MEAQLTPEEKRLLDQSVKAVATSLAHGVAKDKIANDLVKKGWPADHARKFVQNIEISVAKYKASPEGKEMLAKAYVRSMLYGLLWFVGGSAITVYTYLSAVTSNSSGGSGRYVVAWGAMIFGLYQFIKALNGWLKNRS